MALTADTWWTNSRNIQGGPEKNMKLPKKRNIVKVMQIMTELWFFFFHTFGEFASLALSIIQPSPNRSL